MEVFVDKRKTVAFKDAKISRHKTVDGDHGRIETHETTVIHVSNGYGNATIGPV